MDWNKFERLVRNSLCNLYDCAALETHALGAYFREPPEESVSRGQFLRRLLLEAIEQLRPAQSEPPSAQCAPAAWRPYLILHGRYVEGASLQELQNRLALSERQLRREHRRAIHAVATILRTHVCTPLSEETPAYRAPYQEIRPIASAATPWEDNLEGFAIRPESLSLTEVARGIISMLERRLHSENAEIAVLLDTHLPPVLADRILLRQVLLSLLSYALDTRSDGRVVLRGEAQPTTVTLKVEFQSDDVNSLAEVGIHPLEAARCCVQRLQGTMQEFHSNGQEASMVRLTLTLPRADQSVVLVVDDQPAALQMFRRYLIRSNVQVVGVREAKEVLPLARQIKPRAITLDIMMPSIDGWEILQALQADPETRDIPVIVCSVWDEPELAFSLGAAHFLRKPVTQKDLLNALAQVGALDNLAAQSQASSSAPPSVRGAKADDAS